MPLSCSQATRSKFVNLHLNDVFADRDTACLVVRGFVYYFLD